MTEMRAAPLPGCCPGVGVALPAAELHPCEFPQVRGPKGSCACAHERAYLQSRCHIEQTRKHPDPELEEDVFDGLARDRPLQGDGPRSLLPGRHDRSGAPPDRSSEGGMPSVRRPRRMPPVRDSTPTRSTASGAALTEEERRYMRRELTTRDQLASSGQTSLSSLHSGPHESTLAVEHLTSLQLIRDRTQRRLVLGQDRCAHGRKPRSRTASTSASAMPCELLGRLRVAVPRELRARGIAEPSGSPRSDRSSGTSRTARPCCRAMSGRLLQIVRAHRSTTLPKHDLLGRATRRARRRAGPAARAR